MQELLYTKIKKRYKYRVHRTFKFNVLICGYEYRDRFLRLTKNGKIVCNRGYAWNGSSGPTIDSKYCIVPSLIHDILFQLMRLGVIPRQYEEYANKLYRDMCKRNGMFKVMAWWRYAGLSLFGSKSTLPEKEPKVYSAPAN